MSKNVSFLTSFRARLMMLWASFLILTIVLVFALDWQVQKRITDEVLQQNRDVTEAVNSGFGDFARATSIAQGSLNTSTFLYESPQRIPPTVEHIIIADEFGKVKDSTLSELVDQYIKVPDKPEGVAEGQPGDPVEGELTIHGGVIKTYDLPIRTTNGLHWIIIVMQQGAIINKIDNASSLLVHKMRQWSNLRITATTAVLLLALAIVVILGGRFTRPVKELASAAQRVAAGDLDFQVNINRRDEVGQLAATFNEMISGLKSKHALEEKLNQTERAAVIGRLTQGVAHEIRNPLNVLNLSIDHVNTKYAPDDEGKRRDFSRILSSIKDEIGRLNRMVTDLLNYGRPSKLNRNTVDMAELVKETIDLIKPQADEQGVEVVFERDAANASIDGDGERLKSCMSNIAINALQAMPGGGRLIAKVAGNNGFVEVSFTDTGIGISEESLGKVFEPYFSTKQAGFGLGLAVTKKIVQEHQGEVEVSSRLNEGTTFTLKLPSYSVEQNGSGEALWRYQGWQERRS